MIFWVDCCYAEWGCHQEECPADYHYKEHILISPNHPQEIIINRKSTQKEYTQSYALKRIRQYVESILDK